jgi:Dna[CI] antecedent DciA-like protein
VRSTRPSLPVRLGDSVLEHLDRLGPTPPDAAGMAAVVRAWPDAVGEMISRNAWPARFTRDGTLLVHTSSSAWAFELTQLAETVRATLGAAAPPRLRFVVGRVPERGCEAAPSAQQECVEATPADVAEGVRIASAIDDSALRERVARAVAASLARARTAAGSTDPSGTL